MAIFTTTKESGNRIKRGTLENLASMSKNSKNNENEKIKISEKLNELNLVLNRLIEKLDEEKKLKTSIDELNMNVKNIIENDKIHTTELLSSLTLELRALGKQIDKLK